MDYRRKKRRVKRLWQENPRCFWCGQITILPRKFKHHEKIPRNLATLDHLRSRLNENRCEPNPNNRERSVLSCWQCNFERGNREVKNLPIEELHNRSSHGTKMNYETQIKREYFKINKNRLRNIVFARDGGSCHYCDKKLFWDTITLDHKTPLGRGGNNYPQNIVIACSDCGKLKGNMTEKEFKESCQMEKK
jgi:5-methylcytosine-specific restriction enzyme A